VRERERMRKNEIESDRKSKKEKKI
jgi:hypothetical protein